MNRSTARETIMQMLYQMEIQCDFSDEAKISYIQNNIEEDNQIDFINLVADSCLKNKTEIDNIIEQFSKGWKISRIAKVDLSILRLCIAECKFAADPTPVGVAISEAVKIAKKYGTEDSAKFINGILGSFAKSNGN